MRIILRMPGIFWQAFISPTTFVIISLLWCLDLGSGSLIAYRRSDLFGSMDAFPFGVWLEKMGRGALPQSLWVYFLVILSYMMVASLLFCTVNWFIRRRTGVRGLAEVMVHLGFLLVFAGFVVGSAFGARTQGVRIPEGMQRSVPAMGVSLRLEKIRAVLSEDGSVLDTVSELVLADEDGASLTGKVRTNHPLIHGSTVVYPRGSIRRISGATLGVGGWGIVDLEEGRPVSREGAGTLGIWGILQRGEKRGPYTGPGLFITLRPPGDAAGRSAYLSPVGGMTSVDLEGTRVVFKSFLDHSMGIFDIHRDPGVWMVFAGAVILVLGTMWALAGYMGIVAARGATVRRNEHG